MIRGSLAANAPYAFMFVSAGKGTAFQYCTSGGATAADISGTGAAAPTWVKLVRRGNVITASQSANGTSWTTTGSASIATGTSVQIGLAVSSHVKSELCSAAFANVTR